MRFFKNHRGIRKDLKPFPLKGYIMKKLISLAQSWSHSKIGWVANKAGLLTAGVLGKMGIESGDERQQVIAAVIGLVTVLLELGVKTASDKLVGGLQSKFPTLKKDYWPGPETRKTVEDNL
tara:strand:- start:29 stop:391 length:363 start_codon:yes stop_codon:yes gene_type:complete